MKTWRKFSIVFLALGVIGFMLPSVPRAAAPEDFTGVFYAGEIPEKVFIAEYVPGGSSIRVESPLRDPQRIQVACSTMTVDYSPGWPVDAQTAFNYAVDIWETQICSGVTIEISATWKSLGTGVLGSARPAGIYRSASYPNPDTWYPIALAEKFSGSDLSSVSGYDIDATFNSDFASWYFGTDGNPAWDEWDFVSVVLHEIGHGLGFSGSMVVDSDTCNPANYECYCSTTTAGLACWGYGGYPMIYDWFTVDSGGLSLIDTNNFGNPSAELKTALLGQVYFTGANAVSANGSADVPLYSPDTWAPGSSYAHLDETYNGTANALMTFSLANGEVQHDPGPVTRGIFKDLGWGLAEYLVYIPLLMR